MSSKCVNCKHGDNTAHDEPCSVCINAYEYDNGIMVDLWEPVEPDNVNSPAHYKAFPIEVVDIIRETLTTEQFIGYCLGNEIKYRMRAGIKDKEKIIEDIMKAEKYREWRNETMLEEL